MMTATKTRTRMTKTTAAATVGKTGEGGRAKKKINVTPNHMGNARKIDKKFKHGPGNHAITWRLLYEISASQKKQRNTKTCNKKSPSCVHGCNSFLFRLGLVAWAISVGGPWMQRDPGCNVTLDAL